MSGSRWFDKKKSGMILEVKMMTLDELTAVAFSEFHAVDGCFGKVAQEIRHSEMHDLDRLAESHNGGGFHWWKADPVVFPDYYPSKPLGPDSGPRSFRFT